MVRYVAILLFLTFPALIAIGQVQEYTLPPELSDGSSDPSLFLQQGNSQKTPQEIIPGIYRAAGFGNTLLVTTDEGNVVIDTSLPSSAAAHRKLLATVAPGAPKYIIVTHGHGDHVGGIKEWLGPGTKVIAHSSFVEFRAYQDMLSGFFARRNAAQFGFQIPDSGENQSDNGPETAVQSQPPENTLPLETFDTTKQLKLGGLTFDLAHRPAETYDALTVWIPEKKAIFTGDLLYTSFPNIYTLRGTRPRWALDYVAALDHVMTLNADVLIPSHGDAIVGAAAVAATLKKHRDAIQYVHDATVAGMNAGKDVHTLMREITLPPELALPETYGKVAWSVRGIYEGYVGWFDGNPAHMYDTSPTSSFAALVELAGGAAPVAARAQKILEQGSEVEALQLADAALSADPSNEAALRVRLTALQALRAKSTNFNEAGWLHAAIKSTRKTMQALEMDEAPPSTQ